MSTYIYGPVPSRRLGRSLGIDIVPLKTCTYECVYCQLGKTTNRTTERKEWAPVEDVLEELKSHLASEPDYIAISGSGESTLHSGLGRLIEAVKAITDIPVAVLTNGSLLWLPEVRDALRRADVVIPSLDAGNEQLFRRVNRPHKEISFQRMIDGLCEFRRCYSGKYWLEVLLLGGITGLPAQVEEIAGIADRIGPDRIFLNTVVRPPAEFFALPVPPYLMECFSTVFGKNAEVIGSCDSRPQGGARRVTPQDVLSLVARRPCTLEDIATGLGIGRGEASGCVEELSSAGLLSTEQQQNRLYFRAVCASTR